MAEAVEVQGKPHKHQRRALLDERPIVAMLAGARGGKTFSGVWSSTVDAIEQPGHYAEDVRRGQPYKMGIGAPTFPMLERIIIPDVLRAIPQSLFIGFNRQSRLLRIRGAHTETHLLFLSCKFPTSWHGNRFNRIWIDEFAQVKEEMFDEAQTRLSDRAGKLLLTGTPQGPNWVKSRIYDQIGKDARLGFHTWPTYENTKLPLAVRQGFLDLKKTMPIRYWRRTFEASFDTFAGQIYEDFLRPVHVKNPSDYTFHFRDGSRWGSGPTRVFMSQVCAGVDWGFSEGHEGVIVVAGEDRERRYWILETSDATRLQVFIPNQDSWVTRAKALQQKWRIDRFYCDPARPDHIDLFRRNGVRPVVKAKNDVLAGIQSVAAVMFVGDAGQTHFQILDTPANRALIDEITYYHWAEGCTLEKPNKVNDNRVDGMRYALYSMGAGRQEFDRQSGYRIPDLRA